jgi:hypothetical protein
MCLRQHTLALTHGKNRQIGYAERSRTHMFSNNGQRSGSREGRSKNRLQPQTLESTH